MPDAYISPVANRLGALALRLGDQIADATERATGSTGGIPAALVSLRQWADGGSVDTLARLMRVSHSRAVRIVDGLEAQGWARREPDPADARRVMVWLEPAGRAAADRALRARAHVLDAAVARVGPAEAGALERALAALLETMTEDGDAALQTCRLCDAVACGHFAGACPVTVAADRRRGREG